MKKKALRWIMGIVAGLLLLAIAAVLLIDPIAKSIAETRVEAETGMKTSIGKFAVGLTTATIRIEDFVLKNPEKFGGDTFVAMPELLVEYDRPALRLGKLRLKSIRINVAQVHVVENKDGSKNVDQLQKHQGHPKSSKSQKAPQPSKPKSEPPFVFEGIDLLDVTLKRVRFTSLRNPGQNMERDLGIEHELFRNLRTEQDFQTAAALLTLKAGASFLLGGDTTNPFTLVNEGSKAGKETKNILEDLTSPKPSRATNSPTP